MIEPGWSTNRLLNIARDRIQNWAELAEACDDLTSSGGEFNVEACDTFAYSYRASRRIRHIRSCDRIERWKNETIDDLSSSSAHISKSTILAYQERWLGKKEAATKPLPSRISLDKDLYATNNKMHMAAHFS